MTRSFENSLVELITLPRMPEADISPKKMPKNLDLTTSESSPVAAL